MKSIVRKEKKGFTLIELLIVVVIIGILAAIAIPKFSSTREQAYVATLKADLRNFATTMEGIAAENGGAYKTPTDTIQASSGVTITPSVDADGKGWSATAAHTQTSKTCAIYINLTPVTPAEREGEPGCS